MIPIEPRETFTPEQLAALLEKAGWRLDYVEHFQDTASACFQASREIERLTKELKDANELLRLMAEKVKP